MRRDISFIKKRKGQRKYPADEYRCNSSSSVSSPLQGRHGALPLLSSAHMLTFPQHLPKSRHAFRLGVARRLGVSREYASVAVGMRGLRGIRSAPVMPSPPFPNGVRNSLVRQAECAAVSYAVREEQSLCVCLLCMPLYCRHASRNPPLRRKTKSHKDMDFVCGTTRPVAHE